jgi:DedD protein
MARSESEREAPVVLKHRIVGAVVLVSLAVLILPVVLNPTAPVAQVRPAPGADAGKDGTKLFVSRITPTGEGTKPEQVQKSVSGTLPAPATPAAAPDPVPTIPAPRDQAKAEPKEAGKAIEQSWTRPPAPATTTPTATAKAAMPEETKSGGATSRESSAAKPAEAVTSKVKVAVADKSAARDKPGWIVQAGVFAQRENAERVSARLKSAGYRPSVGPVSYRGKNYFRVYVGPYASQDEARRISARVGQALHEKVAVVAYP